MFNENIDDNATIPSMGVLKLWFVLQDMKTNYAFTPIDMQNLINHYGDKYKHIDKIIMLIYGVSTVKSYTLNEEKIDKSRVNTNELTDKEKQTDIKELITPQVVLDTNIGELVIGYDYAYVKKPTYTPNVELTAKEKVVSNDERILYNIDYPYIFVDCNNNILKVVPPIDYDTYINSLSDKQDKPDYYEINIESLDMKHIYLCQPFDSNQGEQTDKITKALELNDYTFDCNFIIKQCVNDSEDIYLVQQYKLMQKESDEEVAKVYQLVIDNHYNVYNIYWRDSNYICEKLYLEQADI